MSKEAFLKAYLQNLINQGQDMITLTGAIDLVDTAFNDPVAYEQLDAGGKMCYIALSKTVCKD
jgi:hypothetical protein